MPFFDTHVHLSDTAFSTDLEQIVLQADAFLECATSYRDADQVLALAARYPHIYAAVGIHPFFSNLSAPELNSVSHWLYQLQQQSTKIKAIGEIGLDYRDDQPDRKIQYICFLEQLETASMLKLPVSIHCVRAIQDIQKAICNSKIQSGILHGASLSKESAHFFLERNFYLGVGSIVTYHNARRVIEMIKYTPLDYLVLETDSPFMPPEKMRGQRNIPRNARFAAQAIADIKQLPVETVYYVTYQNACKVLQIEEER